MGAPIIEGFAEIDSKEEIVIHVGNVVDGLSVYDLAALLHMPMRQVVECLALEHNIPVARAIYRDLQDTIGAIQPGLLIPLREPLVLPTDSELDDEELCQFLFLILNAYGDSSLTSWQLPARDIYLPLSPDLLDQLSLMYVDGPSPKRILQVGALSQSASSLEGFELAIENLERAISVRHADISEDHSYIQIFAGIQLAQSVVDLQQRHWWSEGKKGQVSAETEAEHHTGLAPLADALDELGEAAEAAFEREFLVEERRCAEALLDLLDTSAGTTTLHRLVEASCTIQREVAVKILDKTFELVERACSALARTERSERFVREHVLDVLEEAGRDLTPAAKSMLLDEGGQLGLETIEEWNTAIQSARAGLGSSSPGSSPLRHLARAIRDYRFGLAAMSAMLEPGVIAQILHAVRTGQGGLPSLFPKASRAFAVMVLRGLANSAVQHRAKEGEAFIAGAPQLRRILRQLRTIDSEVAAKAAAREIVDGEFWAMQGTKLKDLQVRTLPRSPTGATFRMAVSALALGLAIGGDRTHGLEYGLQLASAGVSAGEHAMRAAEFFGKFDPEDVNWVGRRLKVVSTFDRQVRALSGLASFLSAAASATRAYRAFDRGRNVLGLIEATNSIGSGLVAYGQIRALFSGFSAVRGAALANAAGVTIGIAGFVASVIYEEFFVVGTKPVLEAIIASVREIPRSKTVENELRAVAAAIASADDHLSTLRKIVGDERDIPGAGSPTLWRAAKLGFNVASIAKLFDEGDLYVGIVLQRYFDARATKHPETAGA